VTRKALPGVEFRFNWTSLAGCLETVLAYEGKPLPRPALMVLSGLAFRLSVRTTGRPLAADALYRYDPAALAGHLRRVGLDADVYFSPSTGEHDRGLGFIRRSVDKGHPAVVYGLQLPEFGLVYGYDDREQTLAVKTVLSEMVGELLAWERYPADEAAFQMVVVPLKVQRLPENALAAALREAVRGQVDASLEAIGVAQGPAAYVAWAQLLDGGEAIDAQGNAHTIQTLQAARADAAAYLAARPEPELRKAASAYQQEVLVLSRLATYFPFPAGGDVTNRGIRRLAAAALREALAHEQSAIEAMARLPCL
jgi:hypothetical protein